MDVWEIFFHGIPPTYDRRLLWKDLKAVMTYTTNTPSMKLISSRRGGLPTKKFQPKCVNKESLSERRYFVWQGLTDLLYANAKDLIQSGRI